GSAKLAPRVLSVCNGVAQGGHLGNQLATMRATIEEGAVPIALRSSDFQFKPKSKISKQVGAFIAAGGRTVVIEERQLRAVGAAAALAKAHPVVYGEWKRDNRPISHLSVVRAILDLDAAPRPMSKYDTMPLPAEPRPPAKPAPRVPSAQIVVVAAGEIRLGETTTMRKDPVLMPLEYLKSHVALLGATGSGKTTAALSIVEQL